VELQANCVFVHELYSNGKAFNAYVVLQTNEQPVSCSFSDIGRTEQPTSQGRTETYSSTLIDLHAEFLHRFSDFTKTETELKLVSCPLSFDSEKAPPDTQLELIDIQRDSVLE
jgi:hypothetical protein